METIVLERRFDTPLQVDDVRAMGEQAAWCMEQHRVHHMTSFLSLDGRRLVCSFDAPDAEAVRSVLHQLRYPFEAVWPATEHTAPALSATAASAGAEPSLVLVKRRFAGAVEPAAVQAIEERAAPCLARHEVCCLRTYLALDRRRLIGVYAAASAESVHLAQREADVPFEDAWAVRAFDTSR